ncbi:MAG: CobD/CbiB family protein [Azoarcus sp.]|nr:CobD/CbiB family protein [Azoarcus sp.]
MKLFSLVAVLLLEQVRPLPVKRVVLDPLRALVSRVFRRCAYGRERLAWGLIVLGGTALCALLAWLLPFLLCAAFTAGVLYLTLGFRHESHFFTDIHLALRTQGLEAARGLLAEWRGGQAGQYDGADADEVARLAIEQALVAAHRNVFGIIFWFVILGPCGAVMYRLARFLHDEWGGGGQQDPGLERYGQFARHAFFIIDWLPSRMTAILFAIGGNFEDAVFCWRAQSVLWPDRGSAVLTASGAGALGLRLGQPIPAVEGGEVENLDVGVGERAGVDDMQATVGLVWRALVVCLVLLALTAVAVWAGG